ncbi:MAG: hypothetical protein LBL48_05840 [Azoarcus sp.]|jgi:hypothetical protein|nr:hypothetical protein [Azoarcus sp.]
MSPAEAGKALVCRAARPVSVFYGRNEYSKTLLFRKYRSNRSIRVPFMVNARARASAPGGKVVEHQVVAFLFPEELDALFWFAEAAERQSASKMLR